MPPQVQRGFLGVQEINRKGRISPLPQAVQGAQPQHGGPGGEPGIKSEFGRMFSGLGSGVGGARGAPSPANAPPGMPFSNSGPARRDEHDNHSNQNSPQDTNHTLIRQGSFHDRRRKIKEDAVEEENGNGRRTPVGRGNKRAKTTHGVGNGRSQ